MQEEWRDVVGYEGKYMVSSMGRVKSLDRVIKGNRGQLVNRKGGVLNTALTPSGYEMVSFCSDGSKARTMRVHKIVLEAFVSIKIEGMVADHINGIRNDNRPENLRWVTRSENIINRPSIGYYCQTNGTFTAHISKAGKKINLGTYRTREEAQKARLAGEEQHYPGISLRPKIKVNQ